MKHDRCERAVDATQSWLIVHSHRQSYVLCQDPGSFFSLSLHSTITINCLATKDATLERLSGDKRQGVVKHLLQPVRRPHRLVQLETALADEFLRL